MSALDQELERARAVVRELAPRALARLARQREPRAELEKLVEVLDEGAPHLAMRLATIVAQLDTRACEEMQRQIVSVTAERDEACRELERARRDIIELRERLADAVRLLEALT